MQYSEFVCRCQNKAHEDKNNQPAVKLGGDSITIWSYSVELQAFTLSYEIGILRSTPSVWKLHSRQSCWIFPAAFQPTSTHPNGKMESWPKFYWKPLHRTKICQHKRESCKCKRTHGGNHQQTCARSSYMAARNIQTPSMLSNVVQPNSDKGLVNYYYYYHFHDQNIHLLACISEC